MSEKLKQVVDTPPLPQREDSPSEYPPQDQPETPLDSGEDLEMPSAKKSQNIPTDDPFSRFWSGGTADTSDKDKKRHRWLNRKPERRHSVELEALDEQDQRLFKYVLNRERDLPRFYSKCPDAKGISHEHAEFILRHIVQQRHQELQQEELEREKRESERRRQSKLPTDITGKPKRLIPVDPINYDEVKKFDYDLDNANDKKASMKYLFLTRFAKEGRTLEAAYSAWGALTFDPNKDDIEQFILKVEELAKKLGYNEDAEVMAVKIVLPRDVYGICMTYKNLKDLKTFLIELFSYPKMREAVPVTASTAGEPSVFSIGQHVENNVVSPTAADVSKICQDMNALQVRFNKITSADFRSKSSKPWKPEVTPPRRRGGFNRGRGGRQFDNAQRNDRFKSSENNESQNGDNGQRNSNRNFRSGGQGRGNFRGNLQGKCRGRGRFDKSPNVRCPRVACKTVDKDKMRYHYCNEFGHFIRECSKRNRDEKEARRFNEDEFRLLLR